MRLIVYCDRSHSIKSVPPVVLNNLREARSSGELLDEDSSRQVKSKESTFDGRGEYRACKKNKGCQYGVGAYRLCDQY